jgi:hypothetical protein
MKKRIIFFSLLGCLFSTATAQVQLRAAFNNAYQTYSNVPPPLLEAMAYAGSRMHNLIPEDEADYHAGPPRYGLFALVADGKGYFKNNLTDLCAKTGIANAVFKNDAERQIMAMAQFISQQCTEKGVRNLQQMRPVLEALCELPQGNAVHNYAREAWVYEIFIHLQKGFRAGDVVVAPQAIDEAAWFSAYNLQLLKAPLIQVEGGTIINAGAPGANGPDAVDATDYPPALWVASPNFSSRGTSAITAVAIHTMQGSYSGSISWFQNTASQASAHYMVRSSDGQITQMVREASKAWHVGSENPYTIGIEHEGYVSQASWYTTAMYDASAALTRDICADNGISTTACYNGPSSSGGSVLSSSIKIKGHQHFPNQTHTDPGINWDWPRYYNLLNPVTCTATGTLNESFVSTAFANLNWSAVSGAGSYTLEWKAASASTWNTAGSTVNYKTIAGLSASTSYNWRVKTSCSNGGTSAYSATQTFTTKASCWDANESNNVYTSPTTYNLNGYTYGKICGSGDIDFYKVTTTATQNIVFKLQTLPKNYNIETYTGAGAYLAGGYATGTADETVTLFSKPAGSYLFRVYGATSTDNDAINDYRLQVTLQAPTIAPPQAAINEAEALQAQTLRIYPNPAGSETTIQWMMTMPGQARVVVTDHVGRNVFAQQQTLSAGRQLLTLETARWLPGVYTVKLMTNNGSLTKKFVVMY